MARQAFPWYRQDKGCWFVWHAGKQLKLHADKDEAFRLWHRLEAEADWQQNGPNVAAIIDTYLSDAERRLKPSTLASKRKILLRLKSQNGALPALSFTAEVAGNWIRQQGSWGRSLRWLAACVLRSCFRRAVPSLLPSDPVQGLRMPSPKSRGAEALPDPALYERLMAVAPNGIREALFALHATGCRPGEVCRVEARHFDAEAGAWVLDEHKTDSNGKPRIILLSPALVELCRTLAMRHPVGTLFRNSKGGTLSPDRLRNWLFKTRRRLGLGRITPYSFRHGFATDALANGVPDAHVAELLGHCGTAMLHRHYSHLTARAKTLKAALEKVR
jgi:integrase